MSDVLPVSDSHQRPSLSLALHYLDNVGAPSIYMSLSIMPIEFFSAAHFDNALKFKKTHSIHIPYT